MTRPWSVTVQLDGDKSATVTATCAGADCDHFTAKDTIQVAAVDKWIADVKTRHAAAIAQRSAAAALAATIEAKLNGGQ